jgi:hypothetical protein
LSGPLEKECGADGPGPQRPTTAHTLILGGKAAIESRIETRVREDELRIREGYRRHYGHDPDNEWVLDILAVKWGAASPAATRRWKVPPSGHRAAARVH